MCEKHRLAPTVFYRWQKQLFENGGGAFECGSEKRSAKEAERVSQLEAKLRKKDEVLSEHIALKKELGEF